MQCNVDQHSAVKWNGLLNNATACNRTQRNTAPYDTVKFSAQMQYSPTQRNAKLLMRSIAMKQLHRNAVQRHDAQHSARQHATEAMQRKATQGKARQGKTAVWSLPIHHDEDSASLHGAAAKSLLHGGYCKLSNRMRDDIFRGSSKPDTQRRTRKDANTDERIKTRREGTYVVKTSFRPRSSDEGELRNS